MTSQHLNPMYAPRRLCGCLSLCLDYVVHSLFSLVWSYWVLFFEIKIVQVGKMSNNQLVRVTLLILITGFTLGLAAPNPVSAWQLDIPLNQALVLEGGESTNPRDYDPATTYGSGNKRIFSGLVSFDPKLNLTPDL